MSFTEFTDVVVWGILCTAFVLFVLSSLVRLGEFFVPRWKRWQAKRQLGEFAEWDVTAGDGIGEEE